MCYKIVKGFSKYDFRLLPEAQIYISKSVMFPARSYQIKIELTEYSNGKQKRHSALK